jgi:hypothetical protein
VEQSGDTEAVLCYHVQSVLEGVLLRTFHDIDPRVECFHAAAVTRERACVAIVGASGAGKTTTALSLCSMDWHLITDDVLIVSTETGHCVPLRRRLLPRQREDDAWDAAHVLASAAGPETSARVFGDYPFGDLAAPWKPYALTAIVFLRAFSDHPRLARLGTCRGAIKLARASFTAAGRPPERLMRYLEGLHRVTWCDCWPGPPGATAWALHTALSEPGAAKAALSGTQPPLVSPGRSFQTNGAATRTPFRVTGMSMSPLLKPGDLVLLEDLTAPPRVGDVVLLRLAAALVLHRVVSVDDEGGLLTTRGDAMRRSDAPLPRSAALARFDRLYDPSTSKPRDLPRCRKVWDGLMQRLLRRPLAGGALLAVVRGFAILNRWCR